MTAPVDAQKALHTTLARVLRWGTVLAATVTAAGALVWYASPGTVAAAILTGGLLLFPAVPVAGIAVAGLHFARIRDRLYLVLTAVLLVVVVANVLAGSAH
ncbi:hypothetical protein [Rhodococcus sp. HNM0569]|uniref:hypothetical protein n=1 Tax=Rhodococcus sp. HNM0569 TaxID=2716340 RepID=UPI00146F5043|nr:hypothetical protein [Rhodococcus sp. HNM0569]NLU84939.1 hypothetical protein [Rhodococcus sp. HNM0569]